MKKSEALRILGLSDGASDEQVKAAHRRKVVENHPDKFAQDSAEYAHAEERTKLINEARDVLLSRKWKPEYSGYGPYASPYRPSAGRPSGYSGRPGQGASPFGQDPANPFEGWPFGEGQGTWAWTSWEDVRGQGGTSNPFNPFNPFATRPKPQKSPEERKAEAKKDLRREVIVTLAKVLCVVVFSLTGSFPLGLFFYAIVSLFYTIWKKFKGCIVSFIVPLVFVLSPLTTLLAARAAMLAFVLIVVCLICFVLDIRNIFRLAKAYRSINVPAS